MKTKFKKNGRRLLAAVLCLVMAVMTLPMSAFAWTSEEGVSCTSSFGDYYVGSDGEYYINGTKRKGPSVGQSEEKEEEHEISQA